MPCCAFFSCIYSTRYHATYQVPGTGMNMYSSFCFLRLFVCPLSVFFMFFSPHITSVYCRSECNIANKHTAQLRANSSAQAVAFGMIKSRSAPNHGLLIFAPFTFSCILPCASVAGGASFTRSGALADILVYIFYPTRFAISVIPCFLVSAPILPTTCCFRGFLSSAPVFPTTLCFCIHP